MKMTIRRPDDFHVHLRRGALLEAVLPYTMEHFGRALIMPNTSPPILTVTNAMDYHHDIVQACYQYDPHNRIDFNPIMTIQITDETTPGIIQDMTTYPWLRAVRYIQRE